MSRLATKQEGRRAKETNVDGVERDFGEDLFAVLLTEGTAELSDLTLVGSDDADAVVEVDRSVFALQALVDREGHGGLRRVRPRMRTSGLLPTVDVVEGVGREECVGVPRLKRLLIHVGTVSEARLVESGGREGGNVGVHAVLDAVSERGRERYKQEKRNRARRTNERRWTA
jgi:hypothetical protein